MKTKLTLCLTIITLFLLSGCVESSPSLDQETPRYAGDNTKLCTDICESQNGFYYKVHYNYQDINACYCKYKDNSIRTFIM